MIQFFSDFVPAASLIASAFALRHANGVIVVRQTEYDDETGRASSRTFQLTAKQIAEQITEDRYFDPTFLASWDAACDFIREAFSEWGSATVWKSLKAHKRYQREQHRKACEQATKTLAAKFGVEPGSVQFFTKLRRFIRRGVEREQSYREGLREDGLCATAYPFSSAGVEQWYEMNNDSRSREASLHEQAEMVRSWFKTECPLLWALHREKRLARKGK